MCLRVGHQHSQFWPILARFMDYYSRFGVPKRFPWLSNSKGHLRVGHQDLQFGPILARFLDYYSVFGLGVISMIDEHRGAFTCRSSTLTILADSGTFSALLVTVVGSRSDFDD